MFDEVVAANQDGLRLKRDYGEISLPWSDIQAESMLAMYRQLFELSLETLDGQRLTERAICYAWLMDLKSTAEPAVEALSEENDNFKKRWQSTLNATGSGEKGAGEKGGAGKKPQKGSIKQSVVINCQIVRHLMILPAKRNSWRLSVWNLRMARMDWK